MSSLTVEVTRIVDIKPHPNADRLELATVKGWQCVVSKGTFQPGDLCVYIPIDSVLPENVMTQVYGGSKLQPSPRVKTIKLRGAISQGIAIKPVDIGLSEHEIPGSDVAKLLGITKYEPPAPSFQGGQNAPKPARYVNPHFRKYTGIENAKNYVSGFEAGETVVITEKIHGTNFRAGYVPFHANTLWKRVKRFFGIAPAFEFVYGSHNVQLHNRPRNHHTFYPTDVYAEAVSKYALRDVLKPGEVLYGEVYGDGIQKGYTYGCGPGERKLVCFDLMVNGEWVNPLAFDHWAYERNLPTVPILYKGPFSYDHARELTKGASVLAPSQKVREGVVAKPVREALTYFGRKVLKFISDDYLLKDQTDFH